MVCALQGDSQHVCQAVPAGGCNPTGPGEWNQPADDKDSAAGDGPQQLQVT